MPATLTQEMIDGALATQKKYGVPASVTLGQILVESSGSFPGGLSGLAYNDNNLFGVKAGSSWTGAKVRYLTTEEVNGKPVKVYAWFRKYNSIAESIEDHGRLLATSTYTNVTKGAKDLNDYIDKMLSVYATGSAYPAQLKAYIKQYNLTQYDDGSFPTGDLSGTGSIQGTQTGLFNFIDDEFLSDILRIVFMILIGFLGMMFLMGSFERSSGKVLG